MKKTILLFLFCFKLHFGYAQKENNQWIISKYGPAHSFIDFNNLPPDTSTLLSPVRIFLTDASICDTAGNILFYTNGNIIFNQNHDTLQNGFGINPGSATNYYLPDGMGIPQGALVIPRPNFNNQYYVFYVSAETCSVGSQVVGQPVFLPFSLIDMSLDGGLGGIDSGKKDIHAYDDTLIYGRLTATKHANGRDWWIVAHKSNCDIYNILLVTPDTMILHQQQIGRPHIFEQMLMQAAFSPNGDKYVIELTVDLGISHGNIVDLLDFDRCTGLFSNERHIDVPDSVFVASGCSFSSNGRWLYVNTNKNIFQYDTWDLNINSTVTIVATWDTAANSFYKFYYQQIAPDGKIYVSNYISADYLHVIDQPDLQGINCNVIQGGLRLPATNSFVMPNAVNYSLGPVAGSICDSLTGIAEVVLHDLKLEVAPNPVSKNQTVIVSYALPQNKEGTIEIRNMTGQLIYSNRLQQWSSVHKVKANFSTGVYVITISSLQQKQFAKMVVH